MKPRLREDVFFVPAPDAVMVMAAAHPEGGFGIAGRDSYRWCTRLAAFLNGDHSLGELARSLDQPRRERVYSLVTLLHDQGAVRDAALDQPHDLPEEVRRTYARVIAYLGRLADSPEHRFQRYRQSAPLVVGAGLLVPPLVQALLATGVSRVQLLVSSERPTDLERMKECLVSTGCPAPERRIDLVPIPAGGEAATVDLCAKRLDEGAGGVLHVSEVPMTTRASALAALCDRRGVVFGQARVAGDRALIGPVGPAATAPPPLPAVPCGELLAGPPAAIVANHLCAAFLAEVTGAGPRLTSHFLEVDLETLRTARRTLVAAGEPS